jgi:hypothetical protein
MTGLSTINIEISSKCNKKCHICGRRKRDKEYPPTADTYGFMDFPLLKSIANQVPAGTVVQFHNNGEGLLYPRFGEAVQLFSHCITGLTTNGKLLIEKSAEIINNLDTIAISVFENDPEQREQFYLIRKFLELKGNNKPLTVLRLIGKVDDVRYLPFGVPIARRMLHSPDGSFDYTDKVVIPETGICWDFLFHPAIDRHGNFSICVRFDPNGVGVLGNLKHDTIANLWYGDKRKKWLNLHLKGKRSEVPLCSKCDYYGIPSK